MKQYLLAYIALYIGVSVSLTSCVVVPPVAVKKDNGKHKGWYKNTNNPHNANTTNPGHTKSIAKVDTKGKGNGNGNGKGHGNGKK